MLHLIQFCLSFAELLSQGFVCLVIQARQVLPVSMGSFRNGFISLGERIINVYLCIYICMNVSVFLSSICHVCMYIYHLSIIYVYRCISITINLSIDLSFVYRQLFLYIQLFDMKFTSLFSANYSISRGLLMYFYHYQSIY